jgi:Tol biopolymer transport system component
MARQTNLGSSALLTAGFILIGLAGTAFAAFPGSNGRISFVSGPDIYTMNSDGSDVRQLTSLGPNNSANWQSWSPDGRQLVFSEFPPNVPAQLWLMNGDGSNQHLLLSDATDAAYFPSFSPDGKEVVFSRCPPNSQGDACAIYRVRKDGTGLTALTPSEPGTNDFWPFYSPDGFTIAFQSFNRGGVLGAFYLMNADGSNVRRLTPPEIGAFYASWSPDGSKIAFASHCCDPQNVDIWVINLDGNELKRLTGSAQTDGDIPIAYADRYLSWSPEGNAIVFWQYNPDTSVVAIFVLSLDGRAPALLHSMPAPKTNGPQGRRRRHAPQQIEAGGFFPQWGAAVR